MPTHNLSRHHIYRLTRLAAFLDAQRRHAEADQLDRVVRHAQFWNPIRDLKNWANANEVNANQADPPDLLHLMQTNVDKLCRNSQEQSWFAGLDPSVRPTIISTLNECSRMLADYARAYNQSPYPTQAISISPRAVRLADLAGGLDRDIADVLGLLSNLSNTQMFPRGDALYAALQVRLRAVDDLLLGNISPQQAAAQVRPTSAVPPSTATPSAPARLVDQPGQQLQAPMWGARGQSQPTGENGPYSYPGESYNNVQYLQRERIPGSAEWNNEVQNYLSWGLKNGGLTALIAKMRQDQHTPTFTGAVQQAWATKGLMGMPIQPRWAAGESAAMMPKTPTN